MTDPRNIAHDKKIQQEKKHRHEDVAPGAMRLRNLARRRRWSTTLPT